MNEKIIATFLTAIMTLSMATPIIATALDLGDYPRDILFVGDTLNAYVVYGEDGAVADVVSGTDLAIRLAGESYKEVTTGVLTEESISGEGVKLSTAGNELTAWTSLSSIKSILTNKDLPTILATENFNTMSGGNYEYKQYLYIASDNTGMSATNPAKVVYEKPLTENEPMLVLKAPANQELYTYKMSFSTPIPLSGVSDVDDLREILQGTTINMLGYDFVISDCSYVATYGINDLTLLSGKSVVTVPSNEDKTVTIDGKDFRIHLSSVLQETVGGNTYFIAVGNINGQDFALKSGSTTTVEGVTFGVIKVLRSGITGGIDYIKMTGGAQKVKLSRAGTVTIESRTEPTLQSEIVSSIASGWSSLSLTYRPSTDTWLEVGDELNDKFASAFKLRFENVYPRLDDEENRDTIRFNPSGRNMMLTYTNAVGNERQVYTLFYHNNSWHWASVDAGSPTNFDNNYRDVVFDEAKNISAVEQDYFVIGKTGFSHMMQFVSFTPTNNELSFTDEAGNSITAIISGGKADLIVDGNVYKVFVVDSTKKLIQVDLNGNGYFAGVSDSSYTSYANNVGREYSFLSPEKITTGQGGLYFYNGNNTLDVTTSGTYYPELGFAGIRLVKSGSTVTVATLSNGVWTSESATISLPSSGNYANQIYEVNHIDYVVNCYNSAGTYTCNVGLGTSPSDIQTRKGFILVEESRQGAVEHNWLYFPVDYDSINSRTYIGMPVSNDANYNNIAVIGTSTESRGLTSYGTLVKHLSSTLGGSAEVKYPDTFTFAKVFVLSPDAEITTATTGGETIKEVIPLISPIAKLDSEVTNPSTVNKNLVLVGGSCVNDLVQDLVDSGKLDSKYTCEGGKGSGWVEGEAYIWLIEDGFTTGQNVIVVAGTNREGTRRACLVLQNFKDNLANLDGKKAVKVTQSGISSL